MKEAREDPINVDVCETCAERGRANEPVYRMGMCEFCFKGLPHPKATVKELARERMGAYSRHWPNLVRQEESADPDVDTAQRQNQRRPHERVVEVLVSRNRRVMDDRHIPTRSRLLPSLP